MYSTSAILTADLYQVLDKMVVSVLVWTTIQNRASKANGHLGKEASIDKVVQATSIQVVGKEATICSRGRVEGNKQSVGGQVCTAKVWQATEQAKRMGNHLVGKQVARRVEGAIKVNLLSTILNSQSSSSSSSYSHHLVLTLSRYSLL